MTTTRPLSIHAGRLGALLFAGCITSAVAAQNFVKNPGFEQPLGPDNWTIEYAAVENAGRNAPTNCGPADFMIAGRTIMAHMMSPSKAECEFGGHFAPNHNGLMHAYFRQVVSGLKPGASYTVSTWMSQYTRNPKFLVKSQVYLEALGGADRKQSKVSPYAMNNSNNGNPGQWKQYSVTSTASDKGEIEIRLHYNRVAYTNKQTWEWRNINAFYDNVEVVLADEAVK
jgi:hypothetical protein